jgi:hypothetical protein
MIDDDVIYTPVSVVCVFAYLVARFSGINSKTVGGQKSEPVAKFFRALA